MSPKEKAKELYEKYKFVYIQNYTSIHEVKQCALIAVEEAEKSEYNVLTKFRFVTENYTSDYWQLVKDEIERL